MKRTLKWEKPVEGDKVQLLFPPGDPRIHNSNLCERSWLHHGASGVVLETGGQSLDQVQFDGSTDSDLVSEEFLMKKSIIEDFLRGLSF